MIMVMMMTILMMTVMKKRKRNTSRKNVQRKRRSRSRRRIRRIIQKQKKQTNNSKGKTHKGTIGRTVFRNFLVLLPGPNPKSTQIHMKPRHIPSIPGQTCPVATQQDKSFLKEENQDF